MQSKKTFLSFILFFGDVFLMYSSLFLTLAIRYHDFSFLPGPQTRIYLFNFSFIYLSWFLILFIFDFYKVSFLKKSSDFFRNLIIFFFLAGAFGTIYFYLQPQLSIAPKRILFYDVLIFTILFSFWRFVFNEITKLFNLREKVAIIGYHQKFSELLTDSLKEGDYEISLFYNSDGKSFPYHKLAKFGFVKDPKKFKELIEKEGISTISFVPEFYKNEELVKEIFLNLPPKLNFINFVDLYESFTKKIPLEVIDEPWFLENIYRVERKIDDILKLGFDIFFSFIGFLIFIIFFPFIALAIKLDSEGPILFTQKRMGKNRKIFTLYKFRTMKVDTNQEKELWREKDPNQVTSVGKILRKFYLDELPQFFNILKGDISFVGPRPEWVALAKIFEKEISFYSFRYIVKPGLIGWAQLNFPASGSTREAKEKFQYDLYYIKNRSFWLDSIILFKAVKLFFIPPKQ